MSGSHRTVGQMYHYLLVCPCTPIRSSLQELRLRYECQETGENLYGLLSDTESGNRPNHNNNVEGKGNGY